MKKQLAPPKRATKDQLINKYGFSTQALHVMQDVTPFRTLRTLVEDWAKFLLKSESLEEQRWQVLAKALLEEHYKMKIVLWKPKAMGFVLPGGTYKPDFFYIFEDGTRLHVDVKGNRFQKGYRDARAKMRASATLYWFDRFMVAVWDKGTFALEQIDPDKDFKTELQALAAEIQLMQEKEHTT